MVRRCLPLALVLCSACQAILGIDPDVTVIPDQDGSVVPVCDPNQVDTDIYNCGTCGHDCGGGPCQSGVCQPLVLAQALAKVADIVLDDTFVYWSQEDGSVHRIGKTGGGERSLVTGVIGGNGRLAIDATYVFFRAHVEPGTIFAVDKTTFQQKTIATNQPGLGGMRSDGTDLFWAMNTGDNLGGVRRTVASSVTTLWENRQYPQEIAADDQFLYWTENYQVLVKGPKAGGPEPTELYCGAGVNAIAVDSEAAYWTTQEGSVYRAQKSDSAIQCVAPSMRKIASSTGGTPAFGLAINASQAFFTVPDVGEVWMVAKSGVCEGSICTRRIAYGQLSPKRVSADDQAAYWLNTGDNTIMKVVP